ncbi:MAG: c-type cytochrome [Deltaproteobacteria bacterium]|nr:c-type cytochrome [Deltaproteobacteria bacterium]
MRVGSLLSIAASVFLSSVLFASSSGAGVAEGKKAFQVKKCAACHQIEGPAREKTIQDQLARKGPELWYAGSKFKPEFLKNWLANPKPIRPLEYNSLTKKNAGDHVRLAASEAADMAGYLMSLKSADVKEGAVQPKDNPKGRAIFIKKQACYGCHEVTVRGNTAGGLSGPTLTGASARLNPDWIYAYLVNPRVFKPVKDMPNYAGILNDQEMKDLAAYIGSLN